MHRIFTCALTIALSASVFAGAQTAPKSTRPAAPALPAVELPAEPGEYAIIYTSMGNIVCRLFPDKAPKIVANFKGLAMGAKSWTDPKTGRTRRVPLYTGTTFHRVIPDFMIQGGDPRGDGTGEPGYKIADEINPDLNFSKPGVLAMANSGPNTNGCQFFITVGPAEHLNGTFSIFGEVVSGQDVANAISVVPRDDGDKPKTPVNIIRIVVRTVVATPAKSGN
jgi:peptidyl-prolyl cis-trans isomerase A (cyclophilin A)